MFVLGVTAPVRPWGWQGGTMILMAIFLVIVAFRTTPGLPPRHSAGVVLGIAAVLPVLLRVVLPLIQGVSGD